MINTLLAHTAGLIEWERADDGETEWVGTREQWAKYELLERQNHES